MKQNPNISIIFNDLMLFFTISITDRENSYLEIKGFGIAKCLIPHFDPIFMI